MQENNNSTAPQPEIKDAQDFIFTNSNVQVVKPDYIQPNVNQPDTTRVIQQRIIPNAIQTSMIGNLFSSNPGGTTLGTANFTSGIASNGTSTVVNFTVSDNQGRQLIAFPDVSVFTNATDPSQISPDTQWPNNNFAGNNFPVFINPSNWGNSNQHDVVTTVVMRNNSGADVPFVIAVRWRIITFPQTSSNQIVNS